MKKRYQGTKRYQIVHGSVIIAWSEILKQSVHDRRWDFTVSIPFKILKISISLSFLHRDWSRTGGTPISRSPPKATSQKAIEDRFDLTLDQIDSFVDRVIEFFMDSWFDLNKSQVPWTDSSLAEAHLDESFTLDKIRESVRVPSKWICLTRAQPQGWRTSIYKS